MLQELDTGMKIVALGAFNADVGAAAWYGQKGFLAAFTRNAAGDYTFTVDRAIGNAMAIASVRCMESEIATRSTRISITRLTATTFNVTTMQETGGGGGGASAAIDVDFCICLKRLGAG